MVTPSDSQASRPPATSAQGPKAVSASGRSSGGAIPAVSSRAASAGPTAANASAKPAAPSASTGLPAGPGPVRCGSALRSSRKGRPARISSRMTTEKKPQP